MIICLDYRNWVRNLDNYRLPIKFFKLLSQNTWNIIWGLINIFLNLTSYSFSRRLPNIRNWHYIHLRNILMLWYFAVSLSCSITFNYNWVWWKLWIEGKCLSKYFWNWIFFGSPTIYSFFLFIYYYRINLSTVSPAPRTWSIILLTENFS